jgi:hypothetical protein
MEGRYVAMQNKSSEKMRKRKRTSGLERMRRIKEKIAHTILCKDHQCFRDGKTF